MVQRRETESSVQEERDELKANNKPHNNNISAAVHEGAVQPPN